MKQLTKEEALAFGETEAYKHLPDKRLVIFQLKQDRLCMPWDYFHEKVEAVLGRPVYTHEFGMNRDGLLAEAKGECEVPSLREIMDMIPEEKRIIVRIDHDNPPS